MAKSELGEDNSQFKKVLDAEEQLKPPLTSDVVNSSSGGIEKRDRARAKFLLHDNVVIYAIEPSSGLFYSFSLCDYSNDQSRYVCGRWSPMPYGKADRRIRKKAEEST
ncbi:hypothetical protein L1987_75955 [Smallanthus sonchifolius]|uniref:Uncharacterized protein n=1 Tax=Smallanthus sonchifolius TaxID=185202 RepID=A0ACB9A7V3_9ASTR|nr:hypothetical protein L1987_75955 [Smallanthus sonchifolius]